MRILRRKVHVLHIAELNFTEPAVDDREHPTPIVIDDGSRPMTILDGMRTVYDALHNGIGQALLANPLQPDTPGTLPCSLFAEQ